MKPTKSAMQNDVWSTKHKLLLTNVLLCSNNSQLGEYIKWQALKNLRDCQTCQKLTQYYGQLSDDCYNSVVMYFSTFEVHSTILDQFGKDVGPVMLEFLGGHLSIPLFIANWKYNRDVERYKLDHLTVNPGRGFEFSYHVYAYKTKLGKLIRPNPFRDILQNCFPNVSDSKSTYHKGKA